ncbi:MAG: short-chain dehydrogenase, partial [Bacteroidetes bacterium]
SADAFAKKALKIIFKEKQEAIIAGTKETMAIYLKRFFPSILAKVVRKVNVT